MKVLVTDILVPAGSTIGFGRGFPEGDATKVVYFAGDHRLLANIGDAMLAAEDAEVGLVVEVPDWAVLEIRELP